MRVGSCRTLWVRGRTLFFGVMESLEGFKQRGCNLGMFLCLFIYLFIGCAGS